MRKRILSLILAVTTTLSCSSIVLAKDTDSSSNKKFDRQTVITADNFDSVLKSYGLDPGKTKTVENTNKKGITTVGELEDAMNYIKKIPKEIKINETVSSTSGTSKLTNSISPNATISEDATILSEGTTSTQLSRTTAPTDSYHLIYTLNATYYYNTVTGGKAFRSVDSPFVRIDQGSLGSNDVSHIDSVKSITCSYSPSMATLDSDITVGNYVVVGIPGLPFSKEVFMSSNRVIATINWDTSSLFMPY